MSDQSVPRPPLTTTTSIKPAATVLIAAIVMLGVFILINVIFDSGVAPTPSTVFIAGGLTVDPHSAVLEGCRTNGLPPKDIAAALIVPKGTIGHGSVSMIGSAYDCSRRLSTAHSQSLVLGFYRNELTAMKWQLFSTQASAHGGGEQMLFSRGGSDTFNWILGVTINSHAASSATWTLRLYQDDALT